MAFKSAYYPETDAPGEVYRLHRWGSGEEVLGIYRDTREPDEDFWLLNELAVSLLKKPGARVFGMDGEVTDLAIFADGAWHFFTDYEFAGTFRSLRALTRFIRAIVYANGESDPAALIESQFPTGVPNLDFLPDWPWIRKVFETLEFPTGVDEVDYAWLRSFREKFLKDGLPPRPPGPRLKDLEPAPQSCEKCGTEGIGDGNFLRCGECGARWPRYRVKEA